MVCFIQVPCSLCPSPPVHLSCGAQHSPLLCLEKSRPEEEEADEQQVKECQSEQQGRLDRFKKEERKVDRQIIYNLFSFICLEKANARETHKTPP